VTAPPADRDRKLADWRRWLEDVRKELVRAYWHQTIWTEVRDAMVRHHSDADGSFIVSYSRLYIDSQVMTIRRVSRPNENRSLGRIIAAMLADPEILSRERYLAGSASAESSDFVWAWATDEDPDHIDSTRLQRDLDRLQGANDEADDAEAEAGALARVLDHADKTVAHMDATAPALTTSYGHLRSALETVADIFNDYGGLLDYSTESFEPIAFGGDWHAPLRASLWPEELAAREEWERKYGHLLRLDEN
jgi:hypothetical protein